MTDTRRAMRPTSYPDLLERFEDETNRLRALDTDAELDAARNALVQEAVGLLMAPAEGHLEKLMIWHTDKLYRLLHEVSVIDHASFAFLFAIGGAFSVVTRQYGGVIAYLADNIVPEDRFLGVRAAFKAAGFVVAAPAGDPDARGTFARAIAERRHVLWISEDLSLDELNTLAATLDDTPYVGVFRNDAPTDGTNVQIFRSAGKRELLVAR